LCLDYSGRIVATASEKGTLIRVFLSKTGQQIQELRRGVDRAVISSLAFNLSSDRIACASDRGTVHVFAIHSAQAHAAEEEQRALVEEGREHAPENKKHS